jgi:Domain of unknown function (DUF4954)
LARNSWKYEDRDQRTEKIQNIEHNYLAPDTVNEMFDAIEMLSRLRADKNGNYFAAGFENSDRKTEILKVPQAIDLFKELISFYGITQLIDHITLNKFSSFDEFKKSMSVKIQRAKWINVGGQLMSTADVDKLKNDIKRNKINSWSQVHNYYRQKGSDYAKDKLIHAYTSLLEIENITSKQFTQEVFIKLLGNSVATKTWMGKDIYTSRAKDYINPFRKMVYDSNDEMNAVIGRLEDNQFIQDQLAETDQYKKVVKGIIKRIK